MAKKRLFISLELPDEVIKNLIDETNTLPPFFSNYSFTNKHYHITLAFLGDTDVETIPKIIQLIETTFKKRIICEIGGYLTFDRNDGYILSRKPIFGTSFKDTVENFKKELSKLCPDMDKKEFNPHITLFRKVILKKEHTIGGLPFKTIKYESKYVRLFESNYPIDDEYTLVYERELTE